MPSRQSEWGAEERDFLFPAEISAVEGLRAIGFDALATPLFWEAFVAYAVGGSTTPHKAEHDIEVDMLDRVVRVEVKFSHGHVGYFARIRGKSWTREVFRWAKPRGCRGKNEVEAIVLIGRSLSRRLYAWIIPRDAVGERCPSICITCPEARTNDSGKWDRFAIPFDQIAAGIKRIAAGDGPATLSPKEAERRRVLDKAGQIAFETAIFGPVA